MWVDAILVLSLLVLVVLMVEAAYRLGKDRGYDDGYQAAVDLSYIGQVELIAPWEHRPATRDGELPPANDALIGYRSEGAPRGYNDR